MIPSISTLALTAISLVAVSRADYDPALVGTWSTKSRAVLTGPSFYNPVTDTLIEPALTGISYSFTDDGYYEEAYYRAISNPTTPACPSGIMQWQHGTYALPGNGSIVLQPFGVDGRQLVSTPCSYDQSVYTRYEQAELFLSYQPETDAFHGVPRLNLYRFDGSPMNPMYQVYNPPEMLPTSTLNPTSTATPAATGKAKSRVKRGLGQERSTDSHKTQQHTSGKTLIQPPSDLFNADRWWWLGVGLTGLGTIMFMMPTTSSEASIALP